MHFGEVKDVNLA